MAKDFIPQSWSAFADWTANFNTQLQVLAAKYGVSAAKLAQTEQRRRLGEILGADEGRC